MSDRKKISERLSKIGTCADIVSGDDTAVSEVPLSDLHEFKNHPFRVADDEQMYELADSIRKNGVLTAGTVRLRAEGGYEIISGHRRKRACELAGLETMPVFIMALDDDEAVIRMVDANLQREEVLPSEKARAYRMKYDALKHRGCRDEDREKGKTVDQIGSAAGESGKTVQRYIWLTNLSKDLLDMVDRKKIQLVSGVEVSFLKENEQEWVFGCLQQSGAGITPAQAVKLREYSKDKELTKAMVELILSDDKPRARRFVMKADRISEYFPEEMTDEEIEETIYQLLEEWKSRR
ncbi:MAG: ParB/RepB/Spo0J family partition protein [Lachnospiraceae bacterium]|nr:ParB/RepB/Spo0J family partition protein [Lachnospiraceae bacterium]